MGILPYSRTRRLNQRVAGPQGELNSRLLRCHNPRPHADFGELSAFVRDKRGLRGESSSCGG